MERVIQQMETLKLKDVENENTQIWNKAIQSCIQIVKAE